MTPRPSDDDLERLLDADRGDFGAIYGRLSRAEPPRRLDRAVLAEASRAVTGRPPSSQRWLLGLGSAAGIVLAAGIAWQVGRQMETRETAAPAQRSAPASAPIVVPVQPIERTAPAPSAGGTIRADDADAKQKASAANTARASRTAKPAPPAAALPAPAPPPAPPPPAAAEPQPLEQARKVESEAASPLPVDADKKEFSAPLGDSTAVADRAAPEAARSVQRSTDASVQRRERAAQKPPATPLASVQLRRNMQLAPQDWLAEITRLRREGRRQQAIENIRLFQRMHPDWQLDEELRRLAE